MSSQETIANQEATDPLMATFMNDPVILPSSRNTVDRSTIQTLLLSDQLDPFNRVPLKLEEVLPDTDLLDRINTFKAEKKGAKLKDANVMDETPG